MTQSASQIAVLLSGGVDSAVLAAELAREGRRVHPLYVRCGLYWESVELDHARRFLQAVGGENLAALTVFDLPLGDLYQGHWSYTGEDVPDERTPDEAVYLPGRNVLLLAKPALWCHLHGIEQIALGPLKANPFPDSTPEFYAAYEDALNRAVAGRLRILRPFAHLAKTEVIRRGRGLPLQWTFSCMRPVDGQHCGRCNKCAERRSAFRAAEVTDPTVYAAHASLHEMM